MPSGPRTSSWTYSAKGSPVTEAMIPSMSVKPSLQYTESAPGVCLRRETARAPMTWSRYPGQ